MFGADNQQATRQGAGESSETTCQTSYLSSELASILGMLFTDGCVSPKGNSWRIYFANKSQNLIELFRVCMAKEFAISSNRVRIRERKGTNGMYVAVIDSKEIGSYLVQRFGTFRTLKFKDGELPNAQLPLSDLLESIYLRNFLQVAFSCDGGISFYPYERDDGAKWLVRTVFLSCAHPKLRSDYLLLLNAIGVQARNVPGDNKLKIENRPNIEKFQETIGFVEKTMVTDHSRYWRGCTKQEVLDLMVCSYQRNSVEMMI